MKKGRFTPPSLPPSLPSFLPSFLSSFLLHPITLNRTTGWRNHHSWRRASRLMNTACLLRCTVISLVSEYSVICEECSDTVRAIPSCAMYMYAAIRSGRYSHWKPAATHRQVGMKGVNMRNCLIIIYILPSREELSNEVETLTRTVMELEKWVH